MTKEDKVNLPIEIKVTRDQKTWIMEKNMLFDGQGGNNLTLCWDQRNEIRKWKIIWKNREKKTEEENRNKKRETKKTNQ